MQCKFWGPLFGLYLDSCRCLVCE
uniref:Uncharacterized protein n=1 Tax=Arundo donax TaxID=35708 RepID=A0A0A9FE50_ARUDO